MTLSDHLDTTSLRHPIIGWLSVGIILFCIYLLTPSQQYDADVLLELRAINHLDMSSPDPAHMLYVRMGVPFYRFWLALGYAGDALRPMQILNAFFGAGTILLFGLVLRHFTTQWLLVLLISTIAGLSYAFWTHVVDAFFIVPASFFAIFALLSALKLSSSRSVERRTLLILFLGVGFSLAVLSYQANLALIPALFIASWPSNRKRTPTHLQNWTLVGAILALVAGGGWLWQSMHCAHVQSAKELVNWFSFGHSGVQHGLWRREGLNLVVAVPTAWLATILPIYEGLGLQALLDGTITLDRLPAQLALAFLGVIVVYTIIIASLGRSVFWKTILHNRAFAIGVLWLVVPGIAVTWFDPQEAKLWLIPMFACWLLLTLTLTTPIHSNSSKKSYDHFPVLLVAMLTVLTGLGNFLVPVWPNHRNPSEELLSAQEAINYMNPQDLLLSAGFDWTGYVGYLSDEHRVLNAISIAQYRGKSAVRPLLLKEISATWEQGGHVYIVDYFTPDKEEIWLNWITPFTHLTPEDLEVFPRSVAWQVRNEIVWRLLPPR